MSLLDETTRALKEVRATTSSVLVSYSGGKDAVVVMDLACKTFDHVEGFFMYFVPGIEFLEAKMEEATARWGVRIHQVLHPAAIFSLKYGVYCDPAPQNEYELPDITIWNVYASFIKETGIKVVLTGMKKSDSNSRRRFMAWNEANRQVIHPIASWKKRDVLQYLQLRGIELPASSGNATTGLDLSDRAGSCTIIIRRTSMPC